MPIVGCGGWIAKITMVLGATLAAVVMVVVMLVVVVVTIAVVVVVALLVIELESWKHKCCQSCLTSTKEISL